MASLISYGHGKRLIGLIETAPICYIGEGVGKKIHTLGLIFKANTMSDSESFISISIMLPSSKMKHQADLMKFIVCYLALTIEVDIFYITTLLCHDIYIYNFIKDYICIMSDIRPYAIRYPDICI